LQVQQGDLLASNRHPPQRCLLLRQIGVRHIFVYPVAQLLVVGAAVRVCFHTCDVHRDVEICKAMDAEVVTYFMAVLLSISTLQYMWDPSAYMSRIALQVLATPATSAIVAAGFRHS
jgi:hypothetical protein